MFNRALAVLAEVFREGVHEARLQAIARAYGPVAGGHVAFFKRDEMLARVRLPLFFRVLGDFFRRGLVNLR